MNILIFNTLDDGGGAAKAIYKIHNALLKLQINSTLYVLRKSKEDKSIKSPYSKNKQLPIYFLRSRLDNLISKLYPNPKSGVWSNMLIPFGIKKILANAKPEVVILNWISGGFLSIKDISHIKVPIIWRLPDSFAFTGGCHLSYECERFKDTCGKCPILGSHRLLDLSYWNLKRKQKHFSNKNITLVCPSKWMAARVKSSQVFKNHRVEIIPTGVDLNIFKPINKQFSRELLGLSLNKKIIGIGSTSLSIEKHKGFQYIIEMLRLLNQEYQNENIEIGVFGQKEVFDEITLNIPINYVGYLKDTSSMSLFFNSIDVFVVPSIIDTLPNTAIESLACSTPVVAFNTCGLPDIVDHKINGYLANSFDIMDIVEGIKWVLENDSYNNLCKNARTKAINHFDINKIAKKYKSLCSDLLNSKGSC